MVEAIHHHRISLTHLVLLPPAPRTVLLHLLQEFDNNLGRRPDKDLPLSTLLSVRHSFKAIGEDGHADHGGR